MSLQFPHIHACLRYVPGFCVSSFRYHMLNLPHCVYCCPFPSAAVDPPRLERYIITVSCYSYLQAVRPLCHCSVTTFSTLFTVFHCHPISRWSWMHQDLKVSKLHHHSFPLFMSSGYKNFLAHCFITFFNLTFYVSLLTFASSVPDASGY